jgi:hypothetical protein
MAQMRHDEDFDRVGSLLGDACDAVVSAEEMAAAPARRRSATTAKAAPPDPARALAALWPDIAGPDVAANARPVHLSQGRLVVSTSSSVWAHTLSYMESDLKDKVNERLGPGVIDQIIFRHAGWEERKRSRQAAPPLPRPALSEPLSARQIEALAEVEDLDLPTEIRERILRAMKASFVRGEQDSVR